MSIKKKRLDHFELRKVTPLTSNQQKVFEAYNTGANLSLHGVAGTGKTYIAMFLGLHEILSGSPFYDRLIIVRSVVPSRDIGFLPGNHREKSRVYEEPYREICDDLFGRGDGYDILKVKGLVNFTTTSFLRGLTFNNAIVLVDEIQNMTFSELDTVITRMGDTSRMVLCGDYQQSDLKGQDREGLARFLSIISRLKSFCHVEFYETDIVRSGLVKDYIIQRSRMGV